MKFIVKYSQEKDFIPYINDLWKSNWTDYGTDYFAIGKKYFPIKFMETVKSAKTKENVKNIIIKYWQSVRNQDFKKNTDYLIKWYTKILNEEKDLIIKPLEKAYSEKFPFEKITVYLTTFPMCPYYYEKRWYMVNRRSDPLWLIDVSKHELNHFMFYYYWRDYLKKQNISNEKIEYLKEAFAVLATNNSKENAEKSNVLEIQKIVKQNSNKPPKEIIDLVLKSKLLD
jgi:hypothetical protein